MPEQDTPMPTGNGHPRPHPSGEPGRQYDHLSVADNGPGQTPIEDVVPGVLLVVVGIAMVLLVTLLPGSGVAALAVFVPLGVVFLALGTWLIRRGSRRWAWRKANIHLTGGSYLRP